MTKEKFLTMFITISMLTSIILPITVKATGETNTQWTDLNNAKIEIVATSTVKNQSIEDATSIEYKAKISNVKLNANNTYLVYLHHKDTEITKDKVLYHSHATIEPGKTEATINSVWIDYFLQQNKDIYVSIVERKGTSVESKDSKLVLMSKKIERPELLPKLGNRFHIFFNNQSTNTFFWAPNVNEKNGGEIDRTLKIKIGQVADTNILKMIKENKSKGLEQLLNYAKKIKNYNYTGNIEYQHSKNAGITESLTSKMNLIDGAYYFAYIELDDEKGIYYPVEDIALYRANGTKDLIRFSDKSFTWNIQDDNKAEENDKKEDNNKQEKPNDKVTNTIDNTIKDDTQATGKIPQTGEKIAYIGILALLIAASGIGYVKYRQNQDIK